MRYTVYSIDLTHLNIVVLSQRYRPLPPSNGKVIGDSFSVDQKLQEENSRTIKGGGWALPRLHISHSRSQETSLTTYAQKVSLEVKVE